VDESSPTARALLALELIQAGPGITAERLGSRLGVSERAARRYVAILREAGIPVESVRGPYGGYRVGRGVRLPPLMFTATEALGLVMAVLEAHGAVDTQDGHDPVATALGKLVRVLPEAVARPFEAIRRVSGRRTDPDPPDPATTAALVQACGDQRRLRIGYRLGRDRLRTMEVDPWAVVVRHGRWYLLGWSHAVDERRMFRIDRVAAVEPLEATFEPPADLDPLRDLEEQLSMGWRNPTEVEIDAPAERVRWWLPRSVGRLDPVDDGHCRLVGSTEDFEWYAEQLAGIRSSFRVVGPPELKAAVAALADRLQQAAPGR
jgi:predicted DNA-binding transcriptional regulator YafY